MTDLITCLAAAVLVYVGMLAVLNLFTGITHAELWGTEDQTGGWK